MVDCDPGHDDALALILAHDLAEVLGVTTVSGNAPLTAVTANALAVLELIGADTPVHAGAAGPLVAQLNGAPHALSVHGEGGLGGANLPPPSRAPAEPWCYLESSPGARVSRKLASGPSGCLRGSAPWSWPF